MAGTDVLIVAGGQTAGWRVTSARRLAGAFELAGARTVIADPAPARAVRTFMLTDLVQARAARAAARDGIVRHRPGAIVYASITAALLWPRPGAIWLDALAAENRPGRHGIWQRQVERRRVAAAPLVMTMAPGTLAPLRGRHDEVVVPVTVDASGPGGESRDVAAVAYAADPLKRRLDLVLAAWERARRDDETLLVTGLEWADRPGVRFLGSLPADEFRGLLRRARVFLTAPRREDFGTTALEALADGAMLVTTPAAGAYPALGLARELDPRLVSEDLATAVRHALDDPGRDYAARATELVAPFGRAAVAQTLARRVLPRLLPGWRS